MSLATAPLPTALLDCTVAICVYTAERLDTITAAVAAATAQLADRDRLLVVVDHNPDLHERLQRDLPADPRLRILANEGRPGLSGARNTAIAAGPDTAILVFLDDDALPRPGWLDALRERFTAPDVAAVGGAVAPRWDGGAAPRWFPPEYGWVVGCDYRGMPGHGQAIRNPIGANMAVRRSAFDRAGRFAEDLGRVGALPAGCEETDMGIRITRAWPESRILRDTAAAVDHHVSAARQRPGYFLRRCFHEGRSKAVLAARVGRGRALASERGYVARTLTGGLARHLGAVVRGDLAGAARAAMLAAGTAAAAWGYLTARRTAPPAPFTPVPVVDLDVAGLGIAGFNRADRNRADCDPADPDLAAPVELPAPNAEGELAVLARWGRLPIGMVPVTGADPADPGPALTAALADLAAARTAPPTTLPVSERLVSVVICSLGTEPRLTATVAAVLAQTHDRLDVIVVDNDPARGAARRFVAGIDDARLRVVDQPLRGVSAARNAGLAAARGDVVAFTDDDALPDPEWIAALAAVFDADAEAAVTCVTGLVTAAEFRTRAQVWFEEYGGFDKGFTPLVWSLDEPPPSTAALGTGGERDWFFPYSFGVFGSGNNMAFRTGRLRELDGFDPALGAGTLARGGEDLDMFRAVIAAGDVLVYTPAAHVRHFHRATYPELRRQLYGYGVGMAAVIAKELLAGPRRAGRMAARLPLGVWRLLWPGSAKNARRTRHYPRTLALTELAGYLAGPVRYLRSRRRAAGGRA